jgi:WD40 repeat protein
MGTRWIAFPGNNTVTKNYKVDEVSTYTETSFEYAKSFATNILYYGGKGVDKVSKYMNGNEDKEDEEDIEKIEEKKVEIDNKNAGTIVIRDLKDGKLITSFRGHKDPISYLKFDPSGSLLITASIEGKYVNIFQILPNEDNESTFRHIYR